MACLALLILELPFMNIIVTIRGITRFGIQRLVLTLDMTLFAFRFNVFSFKLVAGIFRGIMLKERRFPALNVMTLIAFLFLKLVLMRVVMAVGRFACLEWYPGEPAFLMALVTLNVYVLINKGIFRFGVVGIDLFPALCCMTLFALRFIFVRVLVARKALFEPLNLKIDFAVDMTFFTLDLNVFACKRVFRIPFMVKLYKVFPSLNVMAALAVFSKFVLVRIFMTG